MKILSHNEEKTVGIVSEPDNIVHLGYFSPMILKEWAEKAEETFGKGEHCAFFFRKSNDGGCKYSLLLGTDKDSFVMVAGCTEEAPISEP